MLFKGCNIEGRKTRIFILIIAEIELLCFAGINVGLNSLTPMFKNEKYFISLCNKTLQISNDNNKSNNNNSNNSSGNYTECAPQNQIIGYVLVTGSIANCMLFVPLGIFFDKFGHRSTKLVSLVTFTMACVTYLFSYFSNNWLLFVGSILFSASSIAFLLCNLPLAQLFPDHANLILSIFTGSYDSSAAVLAFVGYLYIYFYVSMVTSYTVIVITGFIVTSIPAVFYLKELDRYKENSHGIISKYSKLKEENNAVEDHIETKYPTFKSVLCSRYYLMQLVYDLNIVFRYSFFMAQLSLQVEHNFGKNDQKKANHLLTTSSFCFIAGILIAPIGGLLTDYLKKRAKKQYLDQTLRPIHQYKILVSSFGLPLLINAVMNSAYSLFIQLPYVWSFYTACLCFVITRALLFATNAGFLMHVFPKRFYGKLYAVSMCFGSSVSFVQYALLFKEEHKMFVVNCTLIGLSFISLLHPIILLCKF